MGNLENKVCLITGSTGIAEATALHAAEEGAKVFVTGMAVFLLGDRARAITGAVVTVDAGWCVS